MSGVSNKVKMIAQNDLERIMKENEELKKQLAKKNGTPLRLAGRYFRSKFHDYEAYGSWYAEKDGQLIKDEENRFYVFDDSMKKQYFNTQAMRDFLDGKTNSCPFYLEEE